MKYKIGERCVQALYTPQEQNPLLAALPEMLPRATYLSSIRSLPPLPAGLGSLSVEARLQCLPLLSSIFVDVDYMWVVCEQLYRGIASTYSTRTTIEEIRRTNALFRGDALPYSTQPATGSILGVPGMGKTSTIRRTLSLLPQVVEHTSFQGTPFLCKQVLYLAVECPSDCSVKALALNLVKALDDAIGSSYVKQLTSMRSMAASAIATQVKILCLTHHVGLILIDEIQNAVATAQKNKQIKPLIKFLVELTNDTCTSVFFVGTPVAEELFTSQEHLKRRTRGVRLLPFKPDGAYRAFLNAIWPYQLTPDTAPLTEQLANKLYDHSGGIPAYIIKIFQESQAQALLQGESRIGSKIMQKAIDLLSIKVARTYSGGTYISDFSPPRTLEDVPPDGEHPLPQGTGGAPLLPQEAAALPVKRLYANKRGRKAVPRDNIDLALAYQEVSDLAEWLRGHELLEAFPC